MHTQTVKIQKPYAFIHNGTKVNQLPKPCNTITCPAFLTIIQCDNEQECWNEIDRLGLKYEDVDVDEELGGEEV